MTTIKQIDYLLETNDLNESIELLKHKYLNLNEYYTEICAGSDTLISLNPFKQIRKQSVKSVTRYICFNG